MVPSGALSSVATVMLEAMVADGEMRFRGLTREEYETLVDAGTFRDERVELLEGGLFWMTPQGPMHASFIEQLAHELTLGLHAGAPGRYRVRQRLPLAASERSEPQPDLAVVEAQGRTIMAHPATASLVVEVAFSSQSSDLLHKPRIYAGAGLPLLWVVDLPWHEVVVHTDPRNAPVPFYASVVRHSFDTPLSVLGLMLRLADLAS